MTHPRPLGLVLLVLGSLVCQCSESRPTGECETSAECDPDLVCVRKKCRRPCNHDDDCLTLDEECVSGVCTKIAEPRSIGQACRGDQQCATGHCVEKVCCESACADTCASCSNAETSELDGTCAPIQRGGVDTAPTMLCTSGGVGCSGDSCSCDGEGATPDNCRSNSAEPCLAATDCMSGECVCGDAQCGIRICVEAPCGICRYATNATECVVGLGTPAPIDDPGECGGDHSCYAGACLLDVGQGCIVDGDCGSDACECGEANCASSRCAAEECGQCQYTTTGTGCDGSLTAGRACDDNNPQSLDDRCDGAGSCLGEEIVVTGVAPDPIQIASVNFELLLEESHLWQFTQWNDLASGSSDLAGQPGAGDQEVLQLPILFYGEGRWHALLLASQPSVTIVRQSSSVVDIVTRWTWTTPGGNQVDGYATHTLSADGMWEVVAGLTNRSASTIAIDRVEYADSHVADPPSWHRVIAATYCEFTHDTLTPTVTFRIQPEAGAPGTSSEDEPGNCYWSVSTPFSLAPDQSWEVRWTNEI